MGTQEDDARRARREADNKDLIAKEMKESENAKLREKGKLLEGEADHQRSNYDERAK